MAKKKTSTLRVTYHSNYGKFDVTHTDTGSGSRAKRKRSKRTGRTGRAVEESHRRNSK